MPLMGLNTINFLPYFALKPLYGKGFSNMQDQMLIVIICSKTKDPNMGFDGVMKLPRRLEVSHLFTVCFCSIILLIPSLFYPFLSFSHCCATTYLEWRALQGQLRRWDTGIYFDENRSREGFEGPCFHSNCMGDPDLCYLWKRHVQAKLSWSILGLSLVALQICPAAQVVWFSHRFVWHVIQSTDSYIPPF